MQDIFWKLQSFKVKDLKTYDKNPRKISKHDYDHLKRSIEKFGLVDKPVCTPQGLLIGGHQRLKALKSLKIDSVDCWIPSRELSEKEIQEANIRFNRAQGSFDYDVLANEFEIDDLIDWGFTADDFDIDLSTEDEQTSQDDVKVALGLKVSFETSKEQEELFKELEERGYTCKVIKT